MRRLEIGPVRDIASKREIQPGTLAREEAETGPSRRRDNPEARLF